MTFCSKCGTKVDENEKFCLFCGTPVEESIAPTSTTAMKKKMPLWFKILIGLSVLLLIGVTAGILFTEHLVDVIDNQLEALKNSDITKAYYGYTSKEFQAVTSLEQYQQFVESYPAFLNNQSAHFTQRSIQNNICTLKGNLTSQDHTNTPVEYKLIKEDKKWKILSIRILSSKNNNSKSNQTNKDSAEETQSKKMGFGSYHLRSSVNKEESIEQSPLHFKDELKNLYVDLEIANAIKNSIIDLNLQHLESGTAISAKALIEDEGDILLTSVFTPPPTGWPKGNYKLIITTSSGLNKMIDFNIE
jgi:hypothetical protein